MSFAGHQTWIHAVWVEEVSIAACLILSNSICENLGLMAQFNFLLYAIKYLATEM